MKSVNDYAALCSHTPPRTPFSFVLKGTANSTGIAHGSGTSEATASRFFPPPWPLLLAEPDPSASSSPSASTLTSTYNSPSKSACTPAAPAVPSSSRVALRGCRSDVSNKVVDGDTVLCKQSCFARAATPLARRIPEEGEILGTCC